MDKKKKRIWQVFTCLPVLLFLACGAVDRKDGIESLLTEQTKAFEEVAETVDGTEAFAIDRNGEEAAVCTTVFVHICGEVMKPGVYEVSVGSRITDVLSLAGGFTTEAAETQVNLAEPVTDGMQVVIPSVEEKEEADRLAAEEKAGLVNINTATSEQLCTLPGIGESRAAAVIAYREEHGAFASVEDIMQVSGIKNAMFEKIKDLIYVE